MAAKYAQNCIGEQAASFKRWEITADWTKPYPTMDPEYIDQQLKVFGKLYSDGIVYRAFKPVYWLVYRKVLSTIVLGHQALVLHWQNPNSSTIKSISLQLCFSDSE
jgi:valyl-tRNA synthetase